ncbi:MAG: hypothetical protein ACLU37_08245 [Collinsella sp.]
MGSGFASAPLRATPFRQLHGLFTALSRQRPRITLAQYNQRLPLYRGERCGLLGPIVAAVSFGVGTCMGTITPTIAASKQFGMADLGKVTGTITSLEMVGGTVGAIVSGVLFDATGSFASAWIVYLACSVVMLVFCPSGPSRQAACERGGGVSSVALSFARSVRGRLGNGCSVPSFGFQGGINDPFSSVPNRS